MKRAEPAQADDSNCRAHQSCPPITIWSQSITDPVTTPLRGDNNNTTTNSAISSGCVLLLVLL
jgi:hypothetical protein